MIGYTKKIQYAIHEYVIAKFDDNKWRRRKILGFHLITDIIYIVLTDGVIRVDSPCVRKIINGQK